MIECRICENCGKHVPVELLECPDCGFDLTFVPPEMVMEDSEEKTPVEEKSSSCNPVWCIASIEDAEHAMMIEGSTAIGREVGPLKDWLKSNIYVSRNHAYFELEDDGLYIIDNGSTNGTFLNTKRIQAGIKEKLGDGDIVTFANVKFVVKNNAN